MAMIDGDDYTYDTHQIPNKYGGYTIVGPEPLRPGPELAAMRMDSIEARLRTVEAELSALRRQLREGSADDF